MYIEAQGPIFCSSLADVVMMIIMQASQANTCSMGWALAIVPCSRRSKSSDRSRFDWHRNKGHANGAPRSAAHYPQDMSKTLRWLRFGRPCGPCSSNEVINEDMIRNLAPAAKSATGDYYCGQMEINERSAELSCKLGLPWESVISINIARPSHALTRNVYV